MTFNDEMLAKQLQQQFNNEDYAVNSQQGFGDIYESNSFGIRNDVNEFINNSPQTFLTPTTGNTKNTPQKPLFSSSSKQQYMTIDKTKVNIVDFTELEANMKKQNRNITNSFQTQNQRQRSFENRRTNTNQNGLPRQTQRQRQRQTQRQRQIQRQRQATQITRQKQRNQFNRQNQRQRQRQRQKQSTRQKPRNQFNRQNQRKTKVKRQRSRNLPRNQFNRHHHNNLDLPSQSTLNRLRQNVIRNNNISVRSQDQIFRHFGSFSKGLEKEKISQFPVQIYQKGSLPKDQQTCIICYSSYQVGDIIRTLPCLHKFHDQCIDKWLENNNTCPICKFKINK
ncbi:hypothetical protein M0813_25245 [Anaeramoeba flamelloides]|uniref:RING-type E3 ubiquitin transferase n=1 Tax=Anaeramoeba flamelloides TaxID=1746091 RepID=A0ABQ8Y462_9EUKA|nr:hypothetical protein M0813_25245 [Anaeramoeba flamelloides]